MNPFTSFAKKLSFSSAAIASAASSTKRWPSTASRLKRTSSPLECPPQAARVAAARQFGNATHLREQSHSLVAFRWETRRAGSALCSFASLRHNPGFALTAIFILALGMGVSVAIFGFVDAALHPAVAVLRPQSPGGCCGELAQCAPRSNLSRADYEDWKRLNHSFSSLDVYTGNGYLLRTPSGSEPVPAARVTDGFFRTLGVKPMLGRDFRPGEDSARRRENRDPYLWQHGRERFGSRADVVGQSMTLDGETRTRSSEFCHANLPLLRAPMRSSTCPLLDKNECERRRSCHNLFRRRPASRWSYHRRLLLKK